MTEGIFNMESFKKVMESPQMKRMTWWEEWYSMLSPAMREAVDEAAIDYIKEHGGEIKGNLKHMDPVKIPENIAHKSMRRFFGKLPLEDKFQPIYFPLFNIDLDLSAQTNGCLL